MDQATQPKRTYRLDADITLDQIAAELTKGQHAISSEERADLTQFAIKVIASTLASSALVVDPSSLTKKQRRNLQKLTQEELAPHANKEITADITEILEVLLMKRFDASAGDLLRQATFEATIGRRIGESLDSVFGGDRLGAIIAGIIGKDIGDIDGILCAIGLECDCPKCRARREAKANNGEAPAGEDDKSATEE
jgi:hypothetical protein